MKKGEVTFEHYDSIERSAEEIHEAEEEYFNRLWYLRSTVCNPKVGAKHRKEVEEKYKELVSFDNTTDAIFDHGFIAGKLSALRWVMGSDWDSLDT